MKVSILVPVYNAELYLERTMESALSQTWADKEIIIVDDGSTDNSLNIARRFESHVVKVYTQTNAGGGSARNRAFRESSGEYIQYLDADDLITENKIEAQLDVLKNAGPGVIASCSWKRFVKESDLHDRIRHNKDLDMDFDNPIDWLLSAWEGKGMASSSSWLVPRKVVEEAGEWDERLLANQDGEFFCRVLLKSRGIRYAPVGEAYYRNGVPTSITSNKSTAKCKSYLLSYKLYEENILQYENSYRVRHALMCNYLNFMYYNYDTCRNSVEDAKSRIRELGFEQLEIWGKIKFKAVAQFVGFERALKLRSYYRRKIKFKL